MSSNRISPNSREALSAVSTITSKQEYLKSTSGDLNVAVISGGGGSLAAAPLNGQAKIASTGTAVQLGSNVLTNGVIISAKSTNAANITVGGSGVTNTVDGTGNGYILAAGASASWAVTNTNVLWVNGTSGDIISWAGS